MEKAKSLREIALGVIPQMGNFWLPADERPKCREPHGGNLLYLFPKNDHFLWTNPADTDTQFAAKWTPKKLLNVPLQQCVATRAPARRRAAFSAAAVAIGRGGM